MPIGREVPADLPSGAVESYLRVPAFVQGRQIPVLRVLTPHFLVARCGQRESSI
jgi:hypothetical protein